MSKGGQALVSEREKTLRRGLVLVVLSVVWGTATGAWAITAALGSHSLGVLGLGLNVVADVAGSATVAWRLRTELRHGLEDHRTERLASLVVMAALAVVAFFLVTESIRRLVSAQVAHPSASTLAAAAVSFAVLAPLGTAKRRTGSRLASASLRGDGALSLTGAAIALLAFLGLVLNQALGWWWADPVVALIVSAGTTVEAVRMGHGLHQPMSAASDEAGETPGLGRTAVEESRTPDRGPGQAVSPSTGMGGDRTNVAGRGTP